MIIKNSPALIPLILLFTAIIIPIVAYKKEKLAYPLAMLASAFTVYLSIFNVARVLGGNAIHYHFGGWIPPIGIEYVLDPLSAFICAVVNVVSFIILVNAKGLVERELKTKEMPYFAIVMLLLTGFNGIVLTGDFFNLYVFLEISSLSLYGLIAVGERKSPVAAFRYLVMGTVGGSFYLLGVGFIYMTTGSLNMADVKNILPAVADQPTMIVALVFIVVGMGIKMALFPLHGWMPDSYTYAPSASSALIAPIGAKIAVYVMLRVLFDVFGVDYVSKTLPITWVIGWLGAIAILYGSIMAIAQREMKRMLAFSSVAQIGYIGLGIGLANVWGFIGAVLHVMNHAFMKGLLFLIAGNFRTKLGHSDILKFDHRMRKQMPWTTAAFTVGALSMVGVPPTVGFFSKWYLALGAIKATNWVFLAALLVSSLLNAVYFFRIIEKIYLKPIKENSVADDSNVARNDVRASMLIPTLIMAAALLLLGLLNVFVVKGIIMKMIPAGML